MCDDFRVARKGRRADEEERIRAVRLMEAGKSPEQIAEILVGGHEILPSGGQLISPLAATNPPR